MATFCRLVESHLYLLGGKNQETSDKCLDDMHRLRLGE